MKSMLLALSLLFSMTTMADIEVDPGSQTIASTEEVAASQGCFQELETLGCGKPQDDHAQFRSCMHNVFATLNPSCKKMVTELYGNKK